ncbi:hypothetical protein CLV95_111127 [Leptospira borgpetersenii serovar Javanica]|nr:hypothetical protein CLV95_111127 [Leptospira borgpetersenii serovar Javanica]
MTAKNRQCDGFRRSSHIQRIVGKASRALTEDSFGTGSQCKVEVTLCHVLSDFGFSKDLFVVPYGVPTILE